MSDAYPYEIVMDPVVEQEKDWQDKLIDFFNPIEKYEDDPLRQVATAAWNWWDDKDSVSKALTVQSAIGGGISTIYSCCY
jgi:hypothetical protein